MKVLNQATNGLSNLSSTRKSEKSASVKKEGSSAESGSVGKGDSVNISGAAGQMKAMTSKLGEMRAEKLDALKSDIESGRYNPDPADVAEAMVKNVLMF